MYIELEDKDYNTIANAIVNSEEDAETAYVDIDGLGFEVSFHKEIGGEWEDDYQNGTGGFFVTSANVTVYDMKCDNVKVHYNNRHIENIAEELLR